MGSIPCRLLVITLRVHMIVCHLPVAIRCKNSGMDFFRLCFRTEPPIAFICQTQPMMRGTSRLVRARLVVQDGSLHSSLRVTHQTVGGKKPVGLLKADFQR